MKYGSKLNVFLGTTVFSFFSINAAFALDSSLPPSGNFDLSEVKLTLPITEYDYFGDGDSSTAEIQPNRNSEDETCTDNDESLLPLDEGYYDNNYFYTASDGAMVFEVYLGGYASYVGDNYARSELRELYNWTPCNNTSNTNWTPTSGRTDTLSATVAVTDYYSSDPQTIVGQIHAYGTSKALVKMQWDGPTSNVRAILSQQTNSSSNINMTFDNITPGTSEWSYEIEVAYDELTITVSDGSTTQTKSATIGDSSDYYGIDSSWLSQPMYFKVGNYPQASKSSGGTFTVKVTDFDISH